jgi:transposase
MNSRHLLCVCAWTPGSSKPKSQVTELVSFVNGITRDIAAVRAAFSLPWSNGIVEGHVNRLKFLKRQMFGRAHLDLLRVKVLHAI